MKDSLAKGVADMRRYSVPDWGTSNCEWTLIKDKTCTRNNILSSRCWLESYMVSLWKISGMPVLRTYIYLLSAWI